MAGREAKRRERVETSFSIRLVSGRWDVSVRANFRGRVAPSGDRVTLRFDEEPIRVKSTRPKSDGLLLLDEGEDWEANDTFGVSGRRILVSHDAY
jgi:hypothetical protein